MPVASRSTPSIARTAPVRASCRPLPVQATGRLAIRLAEAQGRAFEDIAADLNAATALGVGKAVDGRRDEQIRQALRLVRLARRDRPNAEAYLVLAEGHLKEAIRLDRVKDEHDRTAEASVDDSLEHGRAVVGLQDELLTGRSRA